MREFPPNSPYKWKFSNISKKLIHQNIIMEIFKYLELNDNKILQIKTCGMHEIILRGKFIVSHAFIRKEKGEKVIS